MEFTSDDEGMDGVLFDTDGDDDADLFAEEEEEEFVMPDRAAVRQRHEHLEELLASPGVNERDLREAVEDLTDLGLGGRVAVARLAVSYGNDDLFLQMTMQGVTLDNLAQYVAQDQEKTLGEFLGAVANDEILNTVEDMGFVAEDDFLMAMVKNANEEALGWVLGYTLRAASQLTQQGWFSAAVEASALAQFDQHQILLLFEKLDPLDKDTVVAAMVQTEYVLMQSEGDEDEIQVPETTENVLAELIERVGLTRQDYQERVAATEAAQGVSHVFRDMARPDTVPLLVSPAVEVPAEVTDFVRRIMDGDAITEKALLMVAILKMTDDQRGHVLRALVQHTNLDREDYRDYVSGFGPEFSTEVRGRVGRLDVFPRTELDEANAIGRARLQAERLAAQNAAENANEELMEFPGMDERVRPVRVVPVPGLDIPFENAHDARVFQEEWERARLAGNIPVIRVPELPETCYDFMSLEDIPLSEHANEPDQFVFMDERNATCMTKDMVKQQMQDAYSNLYAPCVQDGAIYVGDKSEPLFVRLVMSYHLYVPLSQIIHLLEMDMPAGEIRVFKITPGRRYERSASFRNSYARRPWHVSAVHCGENTGFTVTNLQRVEVARPVRGTSPRSASIALTPSR